MAKKKETSLQERIQKFIESKGGYVIKTHGDMTSEPGIPDLLCCYKRLFIAIEVKVYNNKPSPQQGIHCRKIMKANGITLIAWSLEEVETLFKIIDSSWLDLSLKAIFKFVNDMMDVENLDNGGSY